MQLFRQKHRYGSHHPAGISIDLITTGLLQEFSSEFQIEKLKEDQRFEHFVAYITVRQHFSEIFEPSDIVVSGGGDLGIDAIAIIVNGFLITDIEAFEDLMSNNPDYLDVTFLFIQAERSAGFEGSKLGTFAYGVGEFFNPNTKKDEILQAVAIMSAIYARSAKFKRGNHVSSSMPPQDDG